MKTVLIIGATGLLGSQLVQYLTLKSRYKLVKIAHHNQQADQCVDMSQTDSALAILCRYAPDIIINLAAITDVDLCQQHLQLAYRINCKIVENIVLYNQQRQDYPAFVVQISTDHVYDSNGETKELAPVIINNYAMTKYCAEKALSCQQATILRTNFIGRSVSKQSLSLTDQMLARYHASLPIRLFNDVYVSPLSINTLCQVIELCMQKQITGTFNVGSKQGMTKENLIRLFFRRLGIASIKYESISIDELGLATPRPKDMRMDVSAFEQAYQFKLPLLIDEINEIADEYKQAGI